MSDHPDDEKLDDSHAAMTKATRQRQRSSTFEMSFVAGAAILIAVSTAFSAWNTFELRKITQDAAKTRAIVLLGTECLVQQLAEHRHVNDTFHRENALRHGYPYPFPISEEPAPSEEKLAKACSAFITSTTTTSKP